MSREVVESIECAIMEALDGENYANGMAALTKCITNVMLQSCKTQAEMEEVCAHLHNNINCLWAANGGSITTRH